MVTDPASSCAAPLTGFEPATQALGKPRSIL